jgi:hypothetical protein
MATFGVILKQNIMAKFAGFVITIIIATSAFFTIAAVSIGSLVLFKKAEEEEEHVKLD